MFIEYGFSLADRFFFRPSIRIPFRDFFHPGDLSSGFLDNIVFHIGMMELVSYWKAACPPVVRINGFRLTREQEEWWRKLYINGLGEFFFLNGITPGRDDFMSIEYGSDRQLPVTGIRTSASPVIPVGGGKDSVVSLELLKPMEGAVPLILNPRRASLQTIRTAGFNDDRYIAIHRTLDPELLRMNESGFLNGHTPFSGLLAFVSVLCAALAGKKYIALSNESSASEPTVTGTEINHQYSKSVEFEADFREYLDKYITPDIHYFSFLRPLNELQIAKVFSGFPAYFPVFKSCNTGSKTDTWCGKCAKCLFTRIILSPFLEPETLNGIFGKDLLDDATLIPVLDELTGQAETRPFDCIGTTGEVTAALSYLLEKQAPGPLPALLGHFRESGRQGSGAAILNELLAAYETVNFLPPEFEQILKRHAGR